MKTSINLILALLLFNPFFSTYAQDEQPHCHVYIDRNGWPTGNVDQLVKVRYDNANLCEGLLSRFACFSCFEIREGCTKNDQSLIGCLRKMRGKAEN